MVFYQTLDETVVVNAKRFLLTVNLNFITHKLMYMIWKQLKRKKRYPVNLLPHSSRRGFALPAFHKPSL